MNSKLKSPAATLGAAAPFVFERFGSAYHLRIETVADLRKVLELDSAHWVAVSAPVATFNLDATFLARLDANHDGQIRAEEVRAAIRKLLAWLSDTGGVQPGNTTLDLATLDTGTAQGNIIRETARKIIRRAGEDGDTTLTLDQVRLVKDEEKRRGLTEAGLVLPEAAAGDARLRTFLNDIVDTVGGVPHSEGEGAISKAKVDRFLTDIHAYLDWQAEAAPGEGDNPRCPFGPDTEALFAIYDAVRGKIDEYFTLADAVRLDPALATHVWPAAHTDGVDFMNADAVKAFLAAAPLARPRADRTLDFTGTLNPAYAVRLERLRTEVLARLLGAPVERLTKAQWATVTAALAPHAAWRAARPEVRVDRLPDARLRAYRDDPALAAAARALIEQSHTAAVELDDVRLVEEVILYQANLLPFLNSFVSFPNLYDPEARALFEMGTLVMDGRHFNLAVRVTNRERHALMSDASNMFVLYISVREDIDGPSVELAVPVTSGGRGNLQVGKRGVFYDLQGDEKHAQVVHLVENPISLKEAIMRPFLRLGHALGGMIERMSAEREAALIEQGKAAAADASEGRPLVAKAEGATETAKTGAGGGFGGSGGMLAGGGVALAALGSSLAFITKTLQGLTWAAILFGGLGILGAVFVPVALAAFLKLRRRDLSAILEGSDWGINARMRLTRSQAHTFTHTPAYPGYTRGIRFHGWWWVGLLALVVLAVVLFFVFR